MDLLDIIPVSLSLFPVISLLLTINKMHKILQEDPETFVLVTSKRCSNSNKKKEHNLAQFTAQK